MSLKIHNVQDDHHGRIVARGVLDDAPFQLRAEDAEWVMTLNNTPVAQRPAENPRCRREANSVIWDILAQMRATQKQAMFFA